jgi:hypothetical protein
VAAVNTPVAVTGGADGSFDLQLDLVEVASEGIGRVQFAPAGGQLLEVTYEVRAHALELVLDQLVTAGKGRPARECLNIAAAYAAGDARGLDGPVGSIDSLADDPAQRVKRVEYTVQSGKVPLDLASSIAHVVVAHAADPSRVVGTGELAGRLGLVAAALDRAVLPGAIADALHQRHESDAATDADRWHTGGLAAGPASPRIGQDLGRIGIRRCRTVASPGFG